MADQGVSIELEAEHVGVITFSNPPHNYFTVDLIQGIVDAMESLRSESRCRVIVLRSPGRHFCAGADFSEPQGLEDPARPHLYEVGLGLFSQPLPVVAEIQGAAIGGGLGLALVADFRVAGFGSRFSANFARLGFHHGFGLTVTLPRVIGIQKSLELLYTGLPTGGEAAQAIGLCDRLVPDSDLHFEALSLAGEIANSAPLAVQSIRQTLRADMYEDVRAALIHERQEQDRLRQTSDWAEGVAAVAERRQPSFTGS